MDANRYRAHFWVVYVKPVKPDFIRTVSNLFATQVTRGQTWQHRYGSINTNKIKSAAKRSSESNIGKSANGESTTSPKLNLHW